MKFRRNITLNLDNVKDNFIELCKDIKYVLLVGVTTFLAYGYLIFHGSIGVDDTALELYFVDGLAPQIGRNTLYLLNKVFRISDFSPVITDFLGVLFMVIAATLLCAIFRECSKIEIESWMCAVFTCTMISFSLISEVYIYYLHNGIGIGYLLTVIALAVLWGDKGNAFSRIVLSGICLTFAVTCYESFAVVFILGAFLIQWFVENKDEQQLESIKNYIFSMFSIVFPAVIAVLGRSTLTKIINGGKAPVKDFTLNSFSSILWIFKDNALQNVKKIIQNVIVNYGIHSVVICSLKFFNVILLVFLIVLVIKNIRNKKYSFLLNSIGIVVVPWLFLVIEGRVTQYRQMQALNLLEAFMLMILCYEMSQKQDKWNKVRKSIVILFSIIVIYNQAYEQNRFYYIDYLKYTEDKTRMDNIMVELCRDFDETKPLCFITEENSKLSGVARQYFYYDEKSPEYIEMSKRANKLGIELKMGEYGYCPVQTLANEVTLWAVGAWNENLQMKNFYAMHGYNISLGTEEMLEKAQILNDSMNAWPEENSIKDMGEYIIIKL